MLLTLAGNSQLFRYVREGAVAVVVIEARHTKVRHVKIRPPIVIVIAGRRAHSPALVSHAGAIGHIFELPIPRLSVKRGPRRLFFPSKACMVEPLTR